ncbi:MAG: hypothetical protein ABR505_05955 [Actinomycetota bacterium]
MLFAGCADNGVTTQEFIARADAICSEMKEDIEALPSPRLPSEIGPHVNASAQVISRGLDRVRALEYPEKDRPTVEAFLERATEAVGYLPGLGRAAAKNQTVKLQETTSKLEAASERAREIARAFGFKVCGGVSDQDLASP